MSLTRADTERDILAHYNLPELYPESWPDDKNDADENERIEKESLEKKAKARATRRYTTLEHARGHSKQKGRSPHRGKTKDEELPPLSRDEPDPLGASASVVALMRKNRVPIERDEELSMITKQYAKFADGS